LGARRGRRGGQLLKREEKRPSLLRSLFFVGSEEEGKGGLLSGSGERWRRRRGLGAAGAARGGLLLFFFFFFFLKGPRSKEVEKERKKNVGGDRGRSIAPSLHSLLGLCFAFCARLWPPIKVLSPAATKRSIKRGPRGGKRRLRKRDEEIKKGAKRESDFFSFFYISLFRFVGYRCCTSPSPPRGFLSPLNQSLSLFL
jgi:hypothetical protein